MSSTTQQVIWVTGASSGLGRSLALQLAARGNQVIATARNAGALEELSGLDTNIIARPCDITSVSSLETLQQEMREVSPGLDQVILNAGSCEYLDFPDPDWSAVRRVMEVNFFGTINCLEIALPMLRRGVSDRPHLVAIASQVIAAPFPRAEAYGASKAALRYFFDSLRIDLANDNIDVSVVNPGFVDTPLTRRNDFEMPFLMDVDVAAKRIIKSLESRPFNYSFPRRLSAILALSKLMPGAWKKAMAPAGRFSKSSSDLGVGK